MMTSSSESVLVIRGEHAGLATPLPTPDLRSGAWTRLGAIGVRGDSVTEDTLDTLAERTRAAAHAQGYAVGWTKGVREAEAAAERAYLAEQTLQAEAEASRAAAHAAAVAALRAAASTLQHLTASVCERLEDQSTELAWAVTTAVLGHGAAHDTAPDVVRRVLSVLPEGPMANVRLHPSVARSTAIAELPSCVTVIADHDMGPADAVVELADHVVDLRIDQALARVREVLA